MERPDWSEPPAGVTPCLRWILENIRRAGTSDELWHQAKENCKTLLPELREDLDKLQQELINMGEGPSEQEPVEARFAAANDCYLQAIDQLEDWLTDPDEGVWADAMGLVERGASLLEQADSLNYSIASQNTVELSG